MQGADKAAEKRAQKALTKLLAEVDAQRATTSTVALSYVIAEWLRGAELEATRRRACVGYVDRTIVPAVGAEPADRLNARKLEMFYSELRSVVSGATTVRSSSTGPRIQTTTALRRKCCPHACRPMAASTVRQIDSIISAALSAAVRWEWIAANLAKVAQRPRQKAPEPDPPSAAAAAHLIDEAFDRRGHHLA